MDSIHFEDLSRKLTDMFVRNSLSVSAEIVSEGFKWLTAERGLFAPDKRLKHKLNLNQKVSEQKGNMEATTPINDKA